MPLAETHFIRRKLQNTNRHGGLLAVQRKCCGAADRETAARMNQMIQRCKTTSMLSGGGPVLS
jgi:hypothetical protein